MISKSVIDALENYVNSGCVHIQESMAAHTTFKVGGPVDCLVEIENPEQLKKVQKYLRQVEIPYFVVGNGSNLLVSDKGYRGVVLRIGRKMNRVMVIGDQIRAEAGALLSQVAKVAYENGLTGMEFASGIPGTVGGAVVMNAGAYDGDMSQIVTKVTVLSNENEILELEKSSMEFGYRTSAIRNHSFIVTEVIFHLQRGDKETIKKRMDELAIKRREKQPLEYPSAGSTFKRPEGHFAGKLIMDAGLAGYQVGGARVSEKHCGFVINTGNATAGDIMQLIKDVQERVKSQFHVDLEPEIVFLGEF